MKLSVVLLAVSMLKAHVEDSGSDVECYTKKDCKVLDFMKEAMNSGKHYECEKKGTLAENAKCQLEAYGLSKDQAELSWKAFPYTIQCNPEPDTEFKTCITGCTKTNDSDSCLESCTMPVRVKVEECLEKLAGKSTSDASKNVKCILECDENSYSEMFDCEYNCHKDVIDALIDNNSSKKDEDSGQKSAYGEIKSSSSGF
jgi:hypothetical protein